MTELKVGEGGAGNKLLIDLNEIIRYGISLLDFQMMLIRCGVPRIDRGQERRVWITYNNRPIMEIGVEEIKQVLCCDLNLLDEWQKNTRIAINEYIVDHKQLIDKLLR